MVSEYNGSYRTKLTSEQKEEFKRIAILEGSVTQVHDRLILDYIKRNKGREARKK